jgi:hypothetical protein
MPMSWTVELAPSQENLDIVGSPPNSAADAAPAPGPSASA